MKKVMQPKMRFNGLAYWPSVSIYDIRKVYSNYIKQNHPELLAENTHGQEKERARYLWENAVGLMPSAIAGGVKQMYFNHDELVKNLEARGWVADDDDGNGEQCDAHDVADTTYTPQEVCIISLCMLHAKVDKIMRDLGISIDAEEQLDEVLAFVKHLSQPQGAAAI